MLQIIRYFVFTNSTRYFIPANVTCDFHYCHVESHNLLKIVEPNSHVTLSGFFFLDQQPPVGKIFLFHGVSISH